MTDFSEELRLSKVYASTLIAGVDEVGRGPLAGPVLAAAVILNPENLPQGAKDSKKLSAPRREKVYNWLMEHAHVSIGRASVEEIDSLNILNATFLAMERALAGLQTEPAFALIDGNALPKNLPCAAEAIVKGDAKILSIACASIVAKVTRDRLMAELAAQHPAYNWAQNAGYGTAEHLAALKEHGVTVHHRRSFAPVKDMV